MPEWKLHQPTPDNIFHRYKCGLEAGQRVVLRKDLVVRNHMGEPTGEVHRKGEIWDVLVGLRSDPVLRFRQPDNDLHFWDDDTDSINEWFEVLPPLPEP